MHKKIFLIIGLFISLPLYSSHIVVGIEANAEGTLSSDSFAKLMSCLTSRPISSIEIEKLPANRLTSSIQKGLIAAAFPARQGEPNGTFNLPPISVGELLLISKSSVAVKNIGILRGDEALYAPFISTKGQQLILESVDTASLLKGLTLNHVDGIYLEKKQIPKKFDAKTFQQQTVYYLPHQIQLSSLFLKQSGLNKQTLIHKANKCFNPHPYKISSQSREHLFHKVSPLIQLLQRKLIITPTTFQDLGKLEKQWSKSKTFRQQIMDSKYSTELRKLLVDSPYVIEALVYNHQGGLLGSNDQPTDFDQSDEDKFTRVRDNENFSLNNISDIQFDLSTNRFLVEITARLFDAQNNYAGGISLGIDINSYLLK